MSDVMESFHFRDGEAEKVFTNAENYSPAFS